MSGGFLIGLGANAMAASYAGLQVTGHNIANANVAGYSRQNAQLATAQGQYTGSGFFGRGVKVESVARAHDVFLTREATVAKSTASMDASRLEQLRRLEDVFQGGDSGLGAPTSALLGALSDLSSAAGDLSARRVVLARAGELATRFNTVAASIETLQAGIGTDLSTTVEQVNTLTRGIAAANQRIVAQISIGQPPNDLLDHRDQLIGELSQHVQLSRIDAADGSASIFIGGGQRLVLGGQASELSVVPDPADASRSALALHEGRTVRTLDSQTLGGGFGGLLRFQNDDLVLARNLVGQLAAALGGALNAQQARGVDLDGDAGAALFSVGAPRALANATNARDGGGALIGTASIAVVDAAALQASDYTLAENPAVAGSWQVTRLADGQTFAVTSGAVVDGMRIDFATLQPGDRYLLQPVGHAAVEMAALLADPRDIAAASPLVAGVGSANTGTAAVAALRVVATPLPHPGSTTSIVFTDDAGHYDWEVRDATSTVVASGSATWAPAQTVPPAGSDFNGFELRLSGVPRNGDRLTVAPTPAAALAANNGNALSLVALGDAGVVAGRSATDAWALALSEIGARVQGADTASTLSTAVAATSEAARSSQAGVNLDEEAARLLQYQLSYQAAAKVLQVAQSVFDTMLDAVRA